MAHLGALARPLGAIVGRIALDRARGPRRSAEDLSIAATIP
jgi:hypothetical protein